MPKQAIFKGVSQVTIDSKGRMAMPSKHRQLLQDQSKGTLVITADRDRCLLIYPAPTWKKIEADLAGLPSLNNQARFIQRLTLGHATECEMNSQGRVLLPLPLREFAHIDKQAVLMGQGRKFELWDEARWNKQKNSWLNKEWDTEDVNDILKQIRL